MNRMAFKEELTLVDLVDPGDALGEHRFAGAVVPTECCDLPCIEVQVDVGQRLHRPEMLVDAACLEKGVFSHGRLLDHLRHTLTASTAESRPRHPSGGAFLI